MVHGRRLRVEIRIKFSSHARQFHTFKNPFKVAAAGYGMKIVKAPKIHISIKLEFSKVTLLTGDGLGTRVNWSVSSELQVEPLSSSIYIILNLYWDHIRLPHNLPEVCRAAVSG